MKPRWRLLTASVEQVERGYIVKRRLSSFPIISMAVVAVFFPPGDLAAQQVRGRLLDAASGEPVVGALVILLDVDDAELTSTVTSTRGTYAIRAAGAGMFQLRIERIGFETSTTEPFSLLADQTESLELTASSSAVILPALTVESEAECHARPEVGEATYVLWEEARKTLRLTERLVSDYRFDGVMYERLVNLWGEALEQGDTQFVSIAGRHPFRSVSRDELEERGYARQAAEGTYFYAPDAEILLSDEFLDSHCFRVRRMGDDPVVGLAFEPVREDRHRVDVKGVLWLDRETSQLRTLEFRYTGVELPSHLGTGPGPYGQMVFDRIESGGWIVREWWIRTPAGSRRRGVQEYVTYSQEGGRVDRVESLHAGRQDLRPVPSVYGPPPAADSAGSS
jgi:hypothetical protein